MKFFPLAHGLADNYFHDTNQADLPDILFERTARLDSIQKEFAKVLLLSDKKKVKWIEANQGYIAQMLSGIRQESMLVVRDFPTDEMIKRTVIEYMVTVNLTLATLEKVMDGNHSFQVD